MERVLRQVPGILEAIVFGASDRHRGETVCACVVAARGLRRESILEACRPRLAPFKIPRRIEFVEAIPWTGRGKADRRALARLIGAPPAPRCG